MGSQQAPSQWLSNIFPCVPVNRGEKRKPELPGSILPLWLFNLSVLLLRILYIELARKSSPEEWILVFKCFGEKQNKTIWKPLLQEGKIRESLKCSRFWCSLAPPVLSGTGRGERVVKWSLGEKAAGKRKEKLAATFLLLRASCPWQQLGKIPFFAVRCK